jgi:hypothetical protein
MGSKKPPEKIGIGPLGRGGGLIQFIVFAVVGIVIFVYCISPELIVMKIIPATLIMLIALGHLVLLGDNWPWAPPAGNWTPAKSRFIAGIGMRHPLGHFHLCCVALHEIHLSQMACRGSTLSLVWGHWILGYPPLRSELGRMAF